MFYDDKFIGATNAIDAMLGKAGKFDDLQPGIDHSKVDPSTMNKVMDQAAEECGGIAAAVHKVVEGENKADAAAGLMLYIHKIAADSKQNGALDEKTQKSVDEAVDYLLSIFARIGVDIRLIDEGYEPGE
jgi:hypothetical protein